MLTIKKTSPDGASEEYTFGDTSEAAQALAALFNYEQSEALKRREEHKKLNAALRREWAGISTTDPSTLFRR